MLAKRTHTTFGFTMVELLLTLTLFAMAMSALVVGLRSGVNGWRTVRIHQTRKASIDRAFKIFGNDFRYLAIVSEEEPLLTETALDEHHEELSFTTLGLRRLQKVGRGAVWARIEYRVRASDDTDSLDFVRVSTPYVASLPMGGDPHEERLLQGVKAISFDYYLNDSTQPTWEDTERLPGGVNITIELDSGGKASKTVWIPCGALGVTRW